MGTTFEYDGLIRNIGQCCLTEEQCGTCEKEHCLIGYCKECILTCLKNRDNFITGGMTNLPVEDTKIYDTDKVAHGIGYLLNQCRNCNLYHDEECLLNVIRSSLEIILFGEVIEYMGSTLLYLNDIKDKNPEIAQKVGEAFKHYQKNNL